MSRLEWKIFLVVWIFLSASVSQFGPRHSSMIQSILHLTVSLVDHRTIMLDRYVLPVVGTLTPEDVRALPHQDLRRGKLSDLAYRGGHYYSGMPPGLSWALLPIDLVTKPLQPFLNGRLEAVSQLDRSETRRLVLAVMAVPLLMAPLAGICAVLLLRMLTSMGVSERAGVWGTIAFLWASLFVLYGSFASHNALAALLLFLAFYVLFTARHGPGAEARRGGWRLFGAGLLAGLAVATNYADALAAGVLLVYGLLGIGARGAAAFAAGAGVVGALHAGYGKAAFGSLISTPYHHRYVFLDDPSGFAHLLYPRPEALLDLTFGLTLGFFLFMPWSLAGLWACLSAIRNRTRYSLEGWCALSILALMLLYNSSIDPRVAPYGFGPRFVMAAIPFLALGLGLRKDCLDRPVVKGAIVLGILLNGLTVISGRAMTLCDRASAHACQLEAVLAHGPRTHAMRAFSDNVHALDRSENVLIFSAWAGLVALLSFGAVRWVDRRFGRDVPGPVDLDPTDA